MRYPLILLLACVTVLGQSNETVSILSPRMQTVTMDTLRSLLSTNLLAIPMNVIVNEAEPIPTSRTFYIAPREDGKAGTGAFNDPHDASTPDKLDTLWRLFHATPAKHKKLVLLPGLYLATNVWQLPIGAHDITIIGNGATIAYTNGAAEGTYTFMQGAYNPANNWMHHNNDILIQGLELDLGTYVKFVGEGKTCGIVAGGSRFVVRDLIIRNMISYSTNDPAKECFAVCLQATNGYISRVLVDNLSCPTGKGGGTAIGVGGDGNIVSECIVNLHDPDPNNDYYSFDFGCFGSRNIYIGNVAQGCDMAIACDNAGNGSMDTDTWSENIFVANSLSASLIVARIHPSLQVYQYWNYVANLLHAEQAPGRDGAMWVDFCQHNPALITPTNQTSGMSFTANLFTGKPRQWGNLNFTNFKWHTLLNNTFTTNASMNLWTNSDAGIYRSGNVLNGKAYDLK